MNHSLVRAATGTLAAAAVTAVLLAIPASTPSQAASITISDPNCTGFSWDSASSTLSCTGGGGGGGAISCSIALSTNSPSVSTAETLTASCSGATGTVSYTWSGGGSGGCSPIVQQGASPNKADVAAPGGSTALNCTYNLVASDNGTNTSSSPTKQISYTTGGGGGGGGGGGFTGSCPGYSSTQVITAQWGSNIRVYTSGFAVGGAVVVKFQTPASIPAGTKQGWVNAVEFNGPTSPRSGSLSANACDFSSSTFPSQVFANNTGPTVNFKLPNGASGNAGALLQPGTWYYFNMVNSPLNSCGGICDMQITVNKPSGS